MSSRADRAFRATRHILPIKVRVRQPNGQVIVQTVDADVREDKRARKGRP